MIATTESDRSEISAETCWHPVRDRRKRVGTIIHEARALAITSASKRPYNPYNGYVNAITPGR
jgi:hypothetical protein